MGNYERNTISPHDALTRLSTLGPMGIRPIGATRRRSGNLLVETENADAANVEALVEPVLGLKCVARRLDDVRATVMVAGQLQGFKSTRQAVCLGTKALKVALTFVSGIDDMPGPNRLSSPNPRVAVVKGRGGGAGFVISLYDRPTKGGDFGEPDKAVQRALQAVGVTFRTTSTRSVRTVAELLALVDRACLEPPAAHPDCGTS